MDERVDNSCKRRAEYLRRFLIIICRERGQWQASFVREKSACLAEVSVIMGKMSMRSVYQVLFLPPIQEPGNEANNTLACFADVKTESTIFYKPSTRFT